MDDKQLKRAELHLGQADKVMHNIIKSSGPLLLNKTRPAYFHALVHAIINQQLSVKAAASIMKRVLEMQGGRVFSADKINKLSDASLRRCGLSVNKIHYIKTLAKAVLHKELNFRILVRQDDESIRKQLIGYPGIGPWSADIFMMRGMGRTDILPIGDLIIRKSMQYHYSLPDNAPYEDYFAIAERWQPYRTIASYYLWKAFQQRP